MENTKEWKERFFALYWGQKVLVSFNKPHFCIFDMEGVAENEYLQLKPLQSIADEDAIEVANKIGYFFDKVVRSDKYIYVTDKYNDFEDQSETLRIYPNGEIFYLNESGKVNELSMEQAETVISFLRSNAISYQFNGVDVNTLIEWGWVKLKEN